MQNHLSTPDGALTTEHERRTGSIFSSLSQAASAALRIYRDQVRSRRDYARLMTMSQRELDDIGLTRDLVREAASDLDRLPFGRM